ncbi:MFS family permease [Arthrobacter pascens]|uniref:MFS transporter n=1 Tax=Arthrobacter pascens TaxID=1677 RepID=UPI0027844AE6|nr:MFS transporter [Arthrobacter pascens]MDQ0632367.1 MFS family permease [Arthrobacter pascens]
MSTVENYAGQGDVRTISERVLLAVAFVMAALEGYDLAVYGVSVPALLNDSSLQVNKASAGVLGSVVAVGMLVGAGLAGALIRRIGALRLILASCIIFSLGMVVSAVAANVVLFGAGRALVGLGLGVILPTLLAYVADLSVPGHRNRNTGIVMAGYAAGGLAAPLLGAVLLPVTSYRWLYIIGVIPALVILPFAWKLLPVPPVHLLRIGRVADAHLLSESMGLPTPVLTAAGKRHLAGIGPLFSSGVAVATLLFWVMTFCGLLLVFGITAWLPTMMQANGYSLASALLQTAAMWVGVGVGVVIGGRIADAVGAKPVVVVAFLTGAVSLMVMSVNPNVVILFIFMFLSGVGFIGSQILVNGFILTRYPDDIRGSGLAWALSFGRMGAIVGPALGAWVLTSGLSVEWNFYTFAIPAVVGAVASVLVPRVKAKTVAIPAPVQVPVQLPVTGA